VALVDPAPRAAGITASAITRRRAADFSYSAVVGLLAGIGFLILVGPVVIVLLTSFTEGRSIKFPPSGLSIQWYQLLFDPVRSAQIHRAALNSLQVAVGAMVCATALATLASVALARRPGRWARALDTFFMSPLILPMLAFGLAALMYFTFLGFRPSLGLIMVGHIVVVAPFVLRTTSASMSQLDPALLESSASLGASWLYTFRRVTLPVIAPGIAAGAGLAVPGRAAQRHAAHPHVGDDGEHARRARRRGVRRPHRRRAEPDARHGARGRPDPPAPGLSQGDIR
jgi:putative spermidine/putrescine transport system permease protein